jgi:heterodisulfide reductase subunit C
MFEMGLIMEYKLRSGALFKDVTAAPGMFARGKMSLAPHKIKDVKDVRRIFEECAPSGAEEVRP